MICLTDEDLDYLVTPWIVDDTTIMRYGLEVGQRSALFLHGSWQNIAFENTGAAVYFFFLKLSENEVARVEIPPWVAHSPEAVDLIQASIIFDSREKHYPDSLLMAHKRIAISRKVAWQLNQLALQVYLQYGGDFHPSAKKMAKGLGLF